MDTVLSLPPFQIRVRSPLKSVAEHLEFFYLDSVKSQPNETFVDFDVQVLPGQGLRRWWHPQARFLLDGVESFFPLPLAQAAPMLEWGLNWCVASRPLGYLVMHAGMVSRGTGALMMPGVPGAGKSTLTAALCLLDGWHLLSDELAILNPATGLMQPHPRPISLKNASIDLVQDWPGAQMGRVYYDTRKGSLSHAAVPVVARAQQPARVQWVIFPRFEAGAAPQCEEISRVEAFTLISEQSFNRERMGETGFDALCTLLTGARCYQLVYGSTADALAQVRAITGA